MDEKKRTFGNMGESRAENEPNLVTPNDPLLYTENEVDVIPENVVSDSKDMEG
jgi:hypothetical protein